MVAAHLLGILPAAGHQVILIERSSKVGRGLAYGTTDINHLLNVTAKKMSAVASDPDHFLDWLEKKLPQIKPGDFVPRSIYGEYVASILSAAEKRAENRVRLKRVRAEAQDVKYSPAEKEFTIQLSDETSATGDVLVLATGHLSPSRLNLANCIDDVWSSTEWRQVSNDARLLIVGTGLTMIDVVISLKATGFKGTITAVSRHGLLPQPHRVQPLVYKPFGELHEFATAKSALKRVRSEIESAKKNGYDWRDVIDALRPMNAQIWSNFSVEEKRRFMRHVRPRWEVARHRVAPKIHSKIQELIKSGELKITKGNADSIELSEYDLVLNCTGPNTNYKEAGHPLLRRLFEKNLIKPDPLGMGIETNKKGQAARAIFALGPLRKGQLWESTAVPELRAQAEEVANEILKTLRLSEKKRT